MFYFINLQSVIAAYFGFAYYHKLISKTNIYRKTLRNVLVTGKYNTTTDRTSITNCYHGILRDSAEIDCYHGAFSLRYKNFYDCGDSCYEIRCYNFPHMVSTLGSLDIGNFEILKTRKGSYIAALKYKFGPTSVEFYYTCGACEMKLTYDSKKGYNISHFVNFSQQCRRMTIREV